MKTWRKMLGSSAAVILFGIVGFSQFPNAAQNGIATPTRTIPPTASEFHPFPISLYCSEVPHGGGGTWQTITIGSSVFHDLDQLMFGWSPNYHRLVWDNKILYSTSFKEASEKQIPVIVKACLDGDTIIVLSISDYDQASLSLSDLVSILDLPDTITWDSSTSRIVFWWEKGIAALVDTDGDREINNLVYFPYQSSSGYEQRYPYNKTCGFVYCYDFLPENIETQLNPFDFEAMVLTITAEPSRTPTPTFTPRPTHTPTPNHTATPP